MKDISILLRLACHEMGNVVTYTRVSSYAHWCIFADLELQLISELHSEKLIDMIKPLQNKANVSSCDVLQQKMTHQLILDASLGSATSTAKDKLPW